jgi:hypothetical protein
MLSPATSWFFAFMGVAMIVFGVRFFPRELPDLTIFRWAGVGPLADRTETILIGVFSIGYGLGHGTVFPTPWPSVFGAIGWMAILAALINLVVRHANPPDKKGAPPGPAPPIAPKAPPARDPRARKRKRRRQGR